MYVDDLDENATLIEDADECIGSVVNGMPVYSLGKLHDWLEEQIEISPEQFNHLGLILDLTPELLIEHLRWLCELGVYRLIIDGSFDD